MRALFFLSATLLASNAFTQNVGINTDGSVPGMMLDVKTTTTATSDGIRINNANGGNGDAIINLQNNGTSVWTLGFDDSDADRFKLDDAGALGTDPIISVTDAGTDGNVGININTPTYELHVTGVDNADYIGWFENTGAGSGVIGYSNSTYNALGGATNNTAGLGAYGVHLPATGAGLGSWGTSNSSDAIGVRGSIPTTGSWLGYGGLFTGGLGYANGVYNLSDERVKENIQIIPNALDKIMHLSGVSYKYNKDYSYVTGNDQRTYLGFIAQDVKEILPEVVAQKNLPVSGPTIMKENMDASQIKNEIFNVVDYTAIIPVMVEAMKEQQNLINDLKAEIELLKKEIENK